MHEFWCTETKQNKLTTYMYFAFISNCVFVTRFRDAYTPLSIHCHLHHQSGVIPPASLDEVIFE